MFSINNVKKEYIVPEDLVDVVEKEKDFHFYMLNGYPCMVIRSVLGFLCGHVGIYEKHPDFYKDYSYIENNYDCHGGVTNYGFVDINENLFPKYKYIGFDCGHYYDRLFYMGKTDENKNYRDLMYVKNEIKNLVDQVDNHPELLKYRKRIKRIKSVIYS
jgi:hypothetical protein